MWALTLPFRDAKCALALAYFTVFAVVIALMKVSYDTDGAFVPQQGTTTIDLLAGCATVCLSIAFKLVWGDRFPLFHV